MNERPAGAHLAGQLDKLRGSLSGDGLGRSLIAGFGRGEYQQPVFKDGGPLNQRLDELRAALLRRGTREARDVQDEQAHAQVGSSLRSSSSNDEMSANSR